MPQSQFLKAQRNEITEYHVYSRLSSLSKNTKTKEILLEIANQEKRHYEKWKAKTGKEVSPRDFLIFVYTVFSKIFGLSFALRLMENGEDLAQKFYGAFENAPETLEIIKEEQHHEKELIALIDDARLKYVSSFVLGLNDALVELSGALAGFTLALQNTKLIAMVGLITGIAASFSMAASSYLAAKEEEGKHAISAGLVTGGAYVITVAFLITPFLIIRNAFMALTVTLSVAISLIALFSFYVAVVKETPFSKKFFNMALISLGVAVLNFGIGFLVKNIFNIDA